MTAGYHRDSRPAVVQQETFAGIDLEEPELDPDDRATPRDLFLLIDARFSFTVDVAATAESAKVQRYYDREANGLVQSWSGERVWCNPPYSNLRPWVEKAWREEAAELVVMLIPANRTDQPWWQELVEPHRDRPTSCLRTEFLPNRIRFTVAGQRRAGPNERPPFGSVLLIWDRRPPSEKRGRRAS